VAVGISGWKRQAITRLLTDEGAAPLRFVVTTDQAMAAAERAGGGIAVWASRCPPDLPGRAAAAGLPFYRMEDGFIRSVGLGAAFHPPCSIVIDRQGIYYDPHRPSDLERLIQEGEFSTELSERAERLAARIVAEGVSKYDRDAPPPRRRSQAGRTVLVAGQVEDDASVATGGAGVAGNLDLLARARAAEPTAHILFKPHPDVDAGHRKGRVPDRELLAFADAIVRDRPMASLLGEVDAVHVLTSLTGFEALLRGLEVTTHGHPFFAGWGLTHDLAGPVPRRTRRVALAELVAATLILYPRYLDPKTGLRCTPEALLDRFASGWRPKIGWLIRARQLQGRIARLLGTTTD
jgi:capsular polysaccharide export protein